MTIHRHPETWRLPAVVACMLLWLLSAPLRAQSAGPASSELQDQIEREFRDYTSRVEAGDDTAALTHAGRARQLAESVEAAPDEQLAILTFNHGLALYRSGDLPAARDALATALTRYRAVYGDEDAALVPVLVASGDAGVSEYAAEAFYQEAVSLAASAPGALYLQTVLQAAEGLLVVHRSPLAEDLVEAGYTAAREQPGADAMLMAKSAYLRGRLLFNLGNIRDAVTYLQEGLDRYRALDQTETKPVLTMHMMLVTAYERMGDSQRATPHCIAVGRLTTSAGMAAADMLPLYRAAPVYPSRALQTGRGGMVEFEFTVTEEGRPDDIRVVGGIDEKIFAKSAQRALEQFRYAPRFEDGVAVATPGVITRITFQVN